MYKPYDSDSKSSQAEKLQVSSWAVMEVIVWNKVLEPRKMEQASTYLMAKLAAGVQEEPRRADSCHVVVTNQRLVGIDGNPWESMGMAGFSNFKLSMQL